MFWGLSTVDRPRIARRDGVWRVVRIGGRRAMYDKAEAWCRSRNLAEAIARALPVILGRLWRRG